MGMLRNSTLKQLRRINTEITKQGGITDRKSPSEKGLSNEILIDNPISGKRNIPTYNVTDIPDADTNVKMKNETIIPFELFENIIEPTNEKVWFYKDMNTAKNGSAFSSSRYLSDVEEHKKRFGDDIVFTVDHYDGVYKTVKEFKDKKPEPTTYKQESDAEKEERIESAKKRVEIKRAERSKNNENIDMNIIPFKLFENTDNDSPQEIMKNMKTIANWHSEDSPKREMNINLIGKYIDNGKVKGYINRIEGNTVFIDNIVEPLGMIKISIKDAVKAYKSEKEDIVADISITGPNNKSLGGAPKEGTSTEPKIDDKSTKATDQKISDDNNIIKVIKFNEFK